MPDAAVETEVERDVAVGVRREFAAGERLCFREGKGSGAHFGRGRQDVSATVAEAVGHEGSVAGLVEGRRIDGVRSVQGVDPSDDFLMGNDATGVEVGETGFDLLQLPAGEIGGVVGHEFIVEAPPHGGRWLLTRDVLWLFV